MSRIILTIAIWLAFAAGVAAQAQPARAQRPNVILINADDLGLPDITAYGGRKAVPTPNIDRIARRGVKFTRGYATAAVCSPSRAALMTGQYQQRHGFEFLAPEGPNAKGLLPDQRLFAEQLQKSGYRTAAVGKWHLGSTPDQLPTARGFDSFFGFLPGELAFISADAPNAVSLPAPYLGERSFRRSREWTQLIRSSAGQAPVVVKNDQAYLTDLLTDEAVRVIDQSRNKPYFLYLPYNAPHSPFQAKASDVERFKHIEDPLQRVYAAMISSMDDGIGRVVEAVERSGRADDTIIIFTADNGAATYFGISECDQLAGGKLSYFEGGPRVPFIVSWPKRWPQGRVDGRNVSQLDLSATILAAAGLRPERPLDGVDLTPLVQPGAEQKVVHEALFFRTGAEYAVLAGDMKLLSNTRPGAFPWVFDLAKDPLETDTLTFRRKDVVADLQRRYTEWEKQMKPPAWPMKETLQINHCGRISFHDN